MGDARLLGDRAHQRRDRRDRQDGDRDQGQPEAKLDEPQAVAAVQDRIARDIVMLGLGVHATSERRDYPMRPQSPRTTPTRSSRGSP